MINVEDVDGVAVVSLAHGKVNALDLELLQTITTTVNGLADAKAVVLTGAGRAFSAGVDLRRMVDDGPPYVGAFLPALSEALLAVFDLPVPVVGAVNGHAIAGGAILAMACDVRLMSGGTIGLTELLVGVTFPAAPFGIAAHAAGNRLQNLVLTGRTVGPDEAAAMGIIDAVVSAEELMGRAVAQAQALARIDAATYAATKATVHAPASALIHALEASDPETIALWQSDKVLGGMRAYLEALAT
ncbi:MAG TPA: enoyl-CoA hydratase/isomerase family protein [Mycobacteriales bacterium]|nr:enoyl-CoA hydratase/isomerase family protein [Mycobacteriales bacterium]